MFVFLLAIISAVMWGLQAIFLKAAMQKVDLYHVIFISLVFNFLLVLSVVTLKSGMAGFGSLDWSFYMYLGVAGLLNHFLGRSFYYSSFRRIGTTQATAISSIYPLISVGSAFFLLKEELQIRQYFGIALTLLGLYCLIWRSRS